MKLEWMGDYREITEQMIRFANAYANSYQTERNYSEKVKFNATQLQVMEYLLENEERNDKMATIAKRLAITPSKFTRTVQVLENKGLVEKFHTTKNKKNTIIKVTDLGRISYLEYVDCVVEGSFREMFLLLDTIPKKYIKTFGDVLDLASANWGMSRSELPPEKLIKIQKKK